MRNDKMQLKRSLRKRLESNPPLFFLLGYLLVILAGTLLLMLPIASRNGASPTPVNALFISASALCVTGLSPVVTAVQWTPFGQAVIALLIQLGGLGIMTAVAWVGIMTKLSFGIASRRVLMEEKGQSELSGMIKLIRFICRSTFLIEFVGMVLLSWVFIPQFGWLRGLWYGVFHSISAFCNAGFDLIGPDSLSGYTSNILMLLTISSLIIIAGIGFTVYRDLLDGNRRLRLHTKIVLSMTLFLLAAGTVLIYLGEMNNPKTLGALPEGEKWLNAYFQSVTTRTAGFFAIDQKALTNAGALVSIVLMFIGGSPAGTAGGIKTTTVVAMSLCVVAEAHTENERSIFHRRIAAETVKRSFIVLFVALLWCTVTAMLLTFTEPGQDLLDIVYETVSAFGTVGLSRNLTPNLSEAGKIAIAMTMLFGKLGPLTLIYAITPQRAKTFIRTAEEPIMIG